MDVEIPRKIQEAMEMGPNEFSESEAVPRISKLLISKKFLSYIMFT